MARWWRERRAEILKFGTVGAVAFIVDLGLFNLLHYGAHPLLADKIVTAKVISAVAATVVSWIGNRLWTFRDRRTDRPIDELLVFSLINAVALLIPVVTVAFTAYVLGAPEVLPANIAAVVGIGIGTATRYVGYRRFVFTDATVLRARLYRALCSAPDRILVVVMALAIACTVTVSFGVFRPWTTLGLATLLATAGWFVIPARNPGREVARGSGWLLSGVAAWLFVNCPFVAEYLIVRRDPGFLTLTGMWLANHPSPDIPTDGSIEAAALVPSARADQGEAWTLHGDVIQSQGAKLLPALTAVGGWVGGTTGVMMANLVIGAVGLIAVYVLAREVMSPIGALVPALSVSLTMSHIWLSRAAYTEPLAMLLLVVSVAWAWRGIKESRAGPVLMAGVASGLVVFARIDGAAYAAGVLIGTAVAIVGTRRWSLARRGGILASFTLLQGLTIAAGYAALGRWSQAYLERLSDEAGQLARAYGLLVAVTVLVALLTILISRSRGTASTSQFSPRAHPSPLTSAALSWVAAGAVAVAFAVLASRPLWTTGHGASRVPDYIEYLQNNAGVPLDATRTYSEATVTWMSYYLTWPLVALGVTGFAAMAWRWGRGEHSWAVPTCALLIPTTLYLVCPSIVPDQVWAIRRLYGSGVTGLVVAAAFGWVWIARWLHRRIKARKAHTVSMAVAVVIALAPMFAWCTYAPGVTSIPILPTSALYLPEQMGARAQVDTLCEYADGRPVFLVGTLSHLGTIRVSCDVPVVYISKSTDAEDLHDMASVWDTPPVVLTGKPDYIPWVDEPSGPTFESTAKYATGALLSLPVEVSVQHFDWYVGDVLPDGTVEFVSTTRNP